MNILPPTGLAVLGCEISKFLTLAVFRDFVASKFSMKMICLFGVLSMLLPDVSSRRAPYANLEEAAAYHGNLFKYSIPRKLLSAYNNSTFRPGPALKNLYQAIRAAPFDNQTQSTLRDQPLMVLAVPQNTVVNVTFEHRVPDAAPSTDSALQFAQSTTSSFSSTSTTSATLSTTLTTLSTTAGTLPSASTSAPQPTANVPGYVSAFLLPLGSEGPNAYRDGPINAVLPPGTVLDAAVSPLPPGPASDPAKAPVVTRKRRVEIKFIDFQMGRVEPPLDINQSLSLSVKYIVGTPPRLASNEETVLAGDSMLPALPAQNGNATSSANVTVHQNVSVVPENLSGFQEIYNGTYSTANTDNKVSVNKIVTAELCGQANDFRQGYVEISIKPLTDPTAAGGASEGYYKCPLVLNYSPAARESESYWTATEDCKALLNANHLNYHLWFQTRQYESDSGSCQNVRPILSEHN